MEDKKKPLTYSELLANKGNWTEDYEHENGQYVNICRFCKQQFVGHKRRPICKLCFNGTSTGYESSKK